MNSSNQIDYIIDDYKLQNNYKIHILIVNCCYQKESQNNCLQVVLQEQFRTWAVTSPLSPLSPFSPLRPGALFSPLLPFSPVNPIAPLTPGGP